MKLKYIAKISLVCGVMSTAVVLSGCGSSKAVQAHAAVVSRSSAVSNSSGIESDLSSGVTVSSDLVSHATPSVSSAVVTSSKPSTGSQSTSHQAPASSKSTGGVTRTTSAAPRPASVAPRPASRPTSTAPTPRPTSTAPVSQSFGSAYGSKYGCSSKSEYDYVVSRASAIDGSSKYNSTYEKNKEYASLWKTLYGVGYSDALNRVLSLKASVPASGGGSNATSAYDVFHDGVGNCVGDSQAWVATLQQAGYNAKIVRGRNSSGVNHAWVRVTVSGTSYDIDTKVAAGTLPGYSIDSVSYN